MAMSYDGKIELYKGPNTNAIKPIGEGDRYFGTNPNATQFDNSTVADCFQFMVNKAKEKGCKVDVYCPDLRRSLIELVLIALLLKSYLALISLNTPCLLEEAMVTSCR